MQKLIFSIGTIIGLAAILLIPNIATHFARANNGSVSFSSKDGSESRI
jgi:hypothetical protein